MNLAFPLTLRSLDFFFCGRLFNSHIFWAVCMLSTCIPFSHSRPNSLLCYLKPQITWQAVNTMSHTTNSLGISSCYSTWMLASWLFCKKKQNGLFLARESVLIFEKVLQHRFAFHVAPFPSPRDRSQSWVSSREGTSFSGDWSGELIQKKKAPLAVNQNVSCVVLAW